MVFENKKILVCGMAMSGIAAARLLKKHRADVTLQDIKESGKFGELPDTLISEGIHLILGRNPDDIIDTLDLLVLSPGVPCDLPFIEKARACNIPVWGEIELAYNLCKCPIIAITGTNGKTTTTSLVGEIMKSHNPGTVTAGNIGIPFTGLVESLGADDCVVAEISSFQLETVNTFRPNISAVLTVTPDHLNRHKTMENYIEMKKRIFAKQTPSDYLVLNYDDKICRNMKQEAKCRTVYYSRLEKLDEGVYIDGGYVNIRYNDKHVVLMSINDINILIENALAAITIAVCAGVPEGVIRDAVSCFKPIEHRIEYVTEINGIKFYNDSKATNPDSAIKALEAMKGPVVLIGGGSDKGSDFGDWVKEFDGKVKFIAVMGEVRDKLIETLKAYGFKNYDTVNSLRDGVALAYGRAERGDCVLLSPACASLDMFDNYEQRGNLFKEYVKALTTE